MHVSVNQFVSHLPAEQQGFYTYSKEAMLGFLRTSFHSDERIKRLLVIAARKQAQGENVLVDHEPEDRQAALAVMYAISKLADTLKDKYRKPNTRRVIQPAKLGKKRYGEFRKKELFINGRKTWIEQYPVKVTHEQAERFQYNPDYDIGDFTFEQGYLETSETAHFEASSRKAGFGALYCDGRFIETVKCWHDDPLENYEYEQWLLSR
jgi:hypothetical protein